MAMLVLAPVSRLSAAELTGTITGVKGDTLYIEMSSEEMPAKDAPGTILLDLDGEGLEAGKACVVTVTGKTVTAVVTEGSPYIDMTVVFPSPQGADGKEGDRERKSIPEELTASLCLNDLAQALWSRETYPLFRLTTGKQNDFYREIFSEGGGGWKKMEENGTLPVRWSISMPRPGKTADRVIVPSMTRNENDVKENWLFTMFKTEDSWQFLSGRKAGDDSNAYFPPEFLQADKEIRDVISKFINAAAELKIDRLKELIDGPLKRDIARALKEKGKKALSDQFAGKEFRIISVLYNGDDNRAYSNVGLRSKSEKEFEVTTLSLHRENLGWKLLGPAEEECR